MFRNGIETKCQRRLDCIVTLLNVKIFYVFCLQPMASVKVVPNNTERDYVRPKRTSPGKGYHIPKKKIENSIFA